MNHSHSVSSAAEYGRKLVRAGVAGVRQGHDSVLHGQPVSTLVANSARHSLKMAAAGACLGLLRYCMVRRRENLSRSVAVGALGSALGFAAGFSWKTRKLASSVAHSAADELRKARDEHWLECNPIDYA